jgi:uncharacterized membrane protein YraQ (UPF0718 family)/copper chaperone CopZ
MTVAWDILQATWLVTAQMAPYLLLGFLVAGVLSVWVSPRWLEAHLGNRGFRPVFKAALFGVPLPLCSCGVIPVGASLMVTYSVLGPVVAILRPLIALATGILGGSAVALTEREGRTAATATTDIHRPERDTAGKIRAAFAYGFGTLPADIGRALALGVGIAGLLSALVPENTLTAYLGGGVHSIVVLMLVGVPLYVCATASVPVAAGFIHMGVSPGAALAFLIAGPATNAAAITTVWRVLGRRTAAIYFGAVVVSALGGGLLLEYLLADRTWAVPAMLDHAHAVDGPSWFGHVAAAVLVAVVLMARFRRPSGPSDEKESGLNEQRIELAVAGMTCSHCRGSVERTLADQPGVRRAQVDLERGQAKVAGHGLDAQQLADAINALGFQASIVSTS